MPKMAIFGHFALRYRETVRVLNTEMVLCFEPRNGPFRRKPATVELKPFKQDDVLINCKPYIVWEALRSKLGVVFPELSNIYGVFEMYEYWNGCSVYCKHYDLLMHSS